MLIYGDSIAYGYGASHKSKDFAGLLINQGLNISRQGSLPNNPSSRPGNMSCDLGYAMYGNLIHDGTILQVGTNDVIVKGISYLSNYISSISALIVWSCCRCKRPQYDSGFDLAGSWSGNNYWPGSPGKYTYQQNASVRFTAIGKSIYLGSYIENNITGSFLVKVDGQDYGRYTCGDSNLTTAHGQTYAPKLITLRNLSEGIHNIEMILDDYSGNNPVMYLDFVSSSDESLWNPFYVLEIPKQITYYPPYGNLALEVYNDVLKALCNNFWNDSLNVQFCTVNLKDSDFMVGQNNGDNLHPNDSGYYKMFHSLYRLIK